MKQPGQTALYDQENDKEWQLKQMRRRPMAQCMAMNTQNLNIRCYKAATEEVPCTPRFHPTGRIMLCGPHHSTWDKGVEIPVQVTQKLQRGVKF